MIVVTARFRVRPEDADRWPDLVRELTADTRAEPGCLWFDWSRSLDDPAEYILIEGYEDDAANAAHLDSAAFHRAQRELPPHLAETVEVVRTSTDRRGWTPFDRLPARR
jgi:quinol monooxygenase YgiN